MKYPKYGTWCKQNIIETIKKQKIHDSKKYLEEFVFNPNSDLYSSGVYDYEVVDILGIINGDMDPSKSLFSSVQHVFADKYFQMAQKINPERDIRIIRRNGGKYTDLLFSALDNISIDEIKDAVMYAFEYGTEEVKEPKITYIKTTTDNVAKVINSDLIDIGRIFIDYLVPKYKREYISTDRFVNYLIHLSQSGIFTETINWRYIELFNNGKYLVEGDIGHNRGYELNVAISVKNKEDRDRVVKILKESEEQNNERI